ncbi:MFS transporter [Parasphingopyxis marina]|uniref:MFS transporter n=1 Tax=Parasphingopyxis marina TaxID=2761622 RepID=A0A842HXW7_9SPHN|nr:MFS transporter [Parasphingopyxis marina]MBC2777169.1 MFS transporter [Parasphingopyxis marina]
MDDRGGELWPRPGRAYWGLTVLTLALLVATLDRSIISLLVEPIKADLQISDTEFSLLTGFAFVFFYAFLGLPIARLADVKSRRAIIAIGIAFWSLCTAACGLAQNFWQLFWARVGVGAGESSFAPATYSILTDSFKPEQLPKVLAINSMGFIAGNGLANLAGGAAIAFITAIGIITVPLIGELKPWQAVFILVGLPGLFVAMLMMTVEEPVRKGQLKRGTGPAKAIPVREIAGFLRDEYRTFLPMFLSLAVKVLLSYGAALWVPALFIRTWGWTAPQVGYSLGLLGLSLAPLGLWLGGVIAERWAKAGRNDAYMRIVLYASIGLLPFAILYPLMPSAEWALACYGANIFIASLGIPAGNAALQVVTPAEMRGQIRALYQFVFNIVGYAMGPLIIALFTDFLFGAEDQLRYSMTLLAIVLGPLAIIVTWWGVKPYGVSYGKAMERYDRGSAAPAAA